MDKTGIIILAAGNSSRLGRPKQLLLFRGRTLLSHIVAESLEACLQPVIVVTGAYQEEIENALRGVPVYPVYNAGWATGMASGIVAGLREALALNVHLRAVIVAVCDQPYISGDLLRSLIERRAESGKGLVACAYAETLGTPVLFDARYFEELTALSGDTGAKHLLLRHREEAEVVPFPKGVVDIDTADDYEELLGV